MSIKKIADTVGVSKTTVSRVINNSGYVGVETRRRIEEVIEEINYIPSSIAKSLSEQKSKTIAIIVPDIQNTFFPDIIKSVIKYTDEIGYNLLVYDTNENKDKEREIFETVVGQRPAGILIALTSDNHIMDDLKIIINSGIEYVLFNSNIADESLEIVAGNDIVAAQQAVQALINAGHKEIAIVTGPLSSTNGKQRYQGYLQALEDNNIKMNDKLVHIGDFQIDSGYLAAKKIIESDATAIFSCNSEMTLGILKYFNEQGICVPQNIALLGYDNPRYFEILGLNVSNIYASTEKIGRMATTILFRKITKQPFYYEKVKTKLKLHGSEEKRG